MVVARLVKHEMHMARSVWMAFQQLEKFANGAVVWNRIWHRNDSIEPEVTIVVALHDSTSVWLLTSSVLYVVEAFTVCFPDVDFCTSDGFARRIFYRAYNETRFTVWVVG
jgi:hypothetical protein